MKQTIFLLLFPLFMSAQKVELNLPPTYRAGKITEFVSYPLFAGSGFMAGLSNKFGKIDTQGSKRPEFCAVAASAGFVTSAGVWGTGISLQGKPKWTDLYKLLGGIGFSTIGFYIGYQTAEIFPSK